MAKKENMARPGAHHRTHIDETANHQQPGIRVQLSLIATIRHSAELKGDAGVLSMVILLKWAKFGEKDRRANDGWVHHSPISNPLRRWHSTAILPQSRAKPQDR
jgi:hypothetical protein